MIYVLVIAFLVLLLWLMYAGIQISMQRLPIFALYKAFAVLTLGLAPALAYLLQRVLPPEAVLQPMPISATTYYLGAIPVLLAIFLGLFNWRKKEETRSDQTLFEAIQHTLRQQVYLPFLLIGYGLVMHFCSPFFPPNLRQIAVFGGMVIWIGVLHLLLSDWGWYIKMGISALVFTFLILNALQSTMFGDLFMWPLWMMLYLQTRYRWPIKRLVLLGSLALICLIFVLLWKYDYRERMARQQGQELILSDTIKDWAKNPLHSVRWQRALDRFNQGNHLAQVYRWVPQKEPYAKGETIVLAIKAALVPRFLWPNKPQAGGGHVWYRFTGNLLSPNVSMNIGLPGEAYANFGPWLALFMVLIWVRFLYNLYYLFHKLALTYYPLLWLWMPLLFYPLIDQENDLLTMLNHAIKGSVFVLVFCGALYKMQQFWVKT